MLLVKSKSRKCCYAPALLSPHKLLNVLRICIELGTAAVVLRMRLPQGLSPSASSTKSLEGDPNLQAEVYTYLDLPYACDLLYCTVAMKTCEI